MFRESISAKYADGVFGGLFLKKNMVAFVAEGCVHMLFPLSKTSQEL